jgi:antirestriction protein ArdC
MPRPATFTTAEGYYATLFHELTHSTGHASRLDLTAGEGKQSASYDREELTAEMVRPSCAPLPASTPSRPKKMPWPTFRPGWSG